MGSIIGSFKVCLILPFYLILKILWSFVILYRCMLFNNLVCILYNKIKYSVKSTGNGGVTG